MIKLYFYLFYSLTKIRKTAKKTKSVAKYKCRTEKKTDKNRSLELI